MQGVHPLSLRRTGKGMEKSQERVFCTNCGAEIVRSDTQCPYCGYINEAAANTLYHEKLDQIHRKLDGLDEVSKGIYRNEWRSSLGRVRRIFIITVVSILLLGGLLYGLNSALSFRDDEEKIKARLRWNAENEEILNQWYEEGEYRELLDFFYRLPEEEHAFFYSWPHSYFVFEYEIYLNCMEIRDFMREGGKIEEEELGEAISSCMSMLFFTYDDLFSEDELERMIELRKELEAFLYTELKFTPKEAAELARKADDDGYLSYKVCYEYAEEILSRYK